MPLQGLPVPPDDPPLPELDVEAPELPRLLVPVDREVPVRDVADPEEVPRVDDDVPEAPCVEALCEDAPPTVEVLSVDEVETALEAPLADAADAEALPDEEVAQSPLELAEDKDAAAERDEVPPPGVGEEQA